MAASRSQDYYLQLPIPTPNKGHVVTFLSRTYGLAEEEIATIGDMPNDVLTFSRSRHLHRHGAVEPRGAPRGAARDDVERRGRLRRTPSTHSSSRKGDSEWRPKRRCNSEWSGSDGWARASFAADKDGHQCVGYDVFPDAVKALEADGAAGSTLARGLRRESSRSRGRSGSWSRRARSPTRRSPTSPRCSSRATSSSTAGTRITATTSAARTSSARRASTTSTSGTSGGVFGLERGFCLMIGGEDEVVAAARADVRARSRPGVGDAPATPGRTGEPAPASMGYLHCGPGRRRPLREDGAQRDRVRAHGGVRRRAERPQATPTRASGSARSTPRPRRSRPRALPVRDRHRRGRRGLAARERRRLVAARPHGRRRCTSRRRSRGSRAASRDSGEGRWTSVAAIDEGVPAPVLTAALCVAVRLARARTTSPTSCSRRCARSSAATTRSGRDGGEPRRSEIARPTPRPSPARGRARRRRRRARRSRIAAVRDRGLRRHDTVGDVRAPRRRRVPWER